MEPYIVPPLSVNLPSYLVVLIISHCPVAVVGPQKRRRKL